MSISSAQVSSRGNILAITFTRKAASEMRDRILTTLRRTADEGGIEPAGWRTLRDHLQDVAISTIDAFCLSLLREFPLEADLDPGFGMADETEALRLVDESLDRTLRICRAAALTDPRPRWSSRGWASGSCARAFAA